MKLDFPFRRSDVRFGKFRMNWLRGRFLLIHKKNSKGVMKRNILTRS
jgi:hypothetical protein